jgi:flagellar hook-length control protein FliK
VPAPTGEKPGARVLPFGLTTDVSAAALAAGGMGASGAGGAVPPQEAGFADALKQVSGEGAGKAAADGAVSGARAVLSGVTAEAIRVPAAAGSSEGALKEASLAALMAGPAAAVPGVGGEPSADGAGGEAATLPDGAAEEEIGADVPGEVLDDATPAVAAAAPPLPGAGPVVAAADAAVAGFTGAASDGGAAAAGSAVPIAGDVPLAGAVPGIVTGAGLGPRTGDAPANGLPNGVVSGGVRTDLPAGAGQLADASGPGLAGTPAGAEAPAAGHAAKAGRRFTSELPEEFRAPPTAALAAGAKGRAGLQGAGLQGAGLQGAGLQGAGVTTENSAAPVPAAAVPGAAPRLAGVLGAETVPTASGQPLAGSGAEPVLTAGAGAAQTAAQTATVGQTPVEPGTLRTAASAAAITVDAEGAAETPVTTVTGAAAEGPESALAGAAKPGANGIPGAAGPRTQTQTQTQASGAATGAGADDRPAARIGVAAGAAVAAAAAALPEGVEDGLSVTSLETGSGADFTAASLRGGEMTGAARTESLQTPNQAQSAHVATQVAAEIARNLKNGQTRFQMRFDPPELGRVDVSLKVAKDGSVQAHLVVERPETLDMFLRDQRGLERALEAAGLNTNDGNLQFSLSQDGGGAFASGEEGDGRPPSFAGGTADEMPDADPESVQRVRMTLAEERGGLDMRV